MDYQRDDEGRVKADNKIKKKRMKVHYPDLFPLMIPFDDKKKVLSEIKNILDSVDFNKNVAIFSKYDLLKPSMLFGFIKLGEYVRYEFMNAYRLLNISLGKDERYSDVTYINSEVLIVYLGYREFNNKRQSDIVEQVIEDRYVRNKKTWLFFKGSKSKFRGKYKGTLDIIKERNFEQIEIKLSGDIVKKRGSKGNSSLDIGIDEI